MNTEPTEAEKEKTASLYKKIRKLLRLAATPGPEGESAQARADELMALHGIDVKLEEEHHRQIVHGVAGEFWREQLLFGMCAARKCRLLLGTHDQAHLCAIVGEKIKVEGAYAQYQVLAIQLENACREEYKNFVRPSYGTPLEIIFRMVEVAAVWVRLYLINAAQTVRARAVEGPVASAAKPAKATTAPVVEHAGDDEVPDNKPPQRTAESKQAAEEARNERELNFLEQLLGVRGAQALQVSAWHRGMLMGNSVSVDVGSFAKRLVG